MSNIYIIGLKLILDENYSYNTKNMYIFNMLHGLKPFSKIIYLIVKRKKSLEAMAGLKKFLGTW